MSGTNPVGTPISQDRTTMTPTGYTSGLDNNLAVARRFNNAFAPHETYEGSPPALGMKVTLDAGYIWDGATLTEVAAQATAALVAPVTNPRIDRVVVDGVTGALSVIAGTEAASPTAPAITAGKIPVAQVLLTVGMTTITNQAITDERVPVLLGVRIDYDASYVSAAGTAGVDNTLQAIVTLTIKANRLNAQKRGIRITVYWEGTGTLNLTCKLGGGSTLSIINLGAQKGMSIFQYLYIDNTHCHPVFPLSTPSGANASYINDAGYINNADQNLVIGQTAGVGAHAIVYSVIVEQMH